jgi:hypothetical protein
LCLGFEQITSTDPPRRITLHFSHIGFTDARTFIALEFVSEKEARRPQESGCGRKKQALRPTEKDSRAFEAAKGGKISSRWRFR